MKKYLWFIFVSLFIAFSTLPTNPIQAESPEIGNTRVVSQNMETTCIGIKEVNGEKVYTYSAIIDSAPKYLPDLETRIVCMWELLYNGNYHSAPNLYSATVNNTTVTLNYNGHTTSWNPILTVAGVTYQPSPVSLLIYDPVNRNYALNTLEWDYGVCVRHLRIIEGMLFENWIFNTDPHGDVVIDSNINDSKDYSYHRQPYAYDGDYMPIAITIEGDKKIVKADAFKGASYPVVIDPTDSFTVSSSDGGIYNQNNDWAVAWGLSYGTIVSNGENIYIGTAYSGSSHIIYRGYFYFDTSSLSGGNISSANLSLYFVERNCLDTITIQTGMPTYPRDPLNAYDYNQALYSGDGGNISQPSISTGTYNNISLNTSWLNIDGWTKLCLRINKDISNTEHSYTTYWDRVYAYEKGAGYRPILYVTYESSASPTVTTNPATYITSSGARLNSYINSDGGEACDIRFQYGTSTGVYTTNTTWVSGYETGESPYLDIEGLDCGDEYFYRVQGNNSQGLSSGDELTFNTSTGVGNVSVLTAMPSSDSVALSWNKASGSTNTIVRYKIGSYPTTYTDGSLVCNISGSSYLHDELSSGLVLYYGVWGWGSCGGVANYSPVGAFTVTTTLASGFSTGSPDTPESPAGWFGATSLTAVENLPGYDIVNSIADSVGMPHATFWMLLSLGVVTLISALIYIRWRNLLLAGLVAGVGMVILSILSLVPLWILAPFIIIAFSVAGNKLLSHHGTDGVTE